MCVLPRELTNDAERVLPNAGIVYMLPYQLYTSILCLLLGGAHVLLGFN